ncbi:MAG: hypothetical protein ABI358_08375 [Ginsengibacter sp.]
MRTKILLTIAAFIFFVVTANAQIEKGTILLGGSINYYSYKSSQPYFYNNYDYKSEGDGANIQIGRAIKTNSFAGIILSYSHTNNYTTAVSPDSNFNKSTTLGAGVFYRKYKKLLKDFYFFAEVSGQYQHGEMEQAGSTNVYYNTKASSNGGTITFTPGISYAVCKNLQMELLMNGLVSTSYTHIRYNYISGTPTVTSDGKSNSFSINANLNSSILYGFGIGFKYFIGK